MCPTSYLLGDEVENANRSASFTGVAAQDFGELSHGGILFIASRSGSSVDNRIDDCTVNGTAGIGVGSFALDGGRNRLLVSRTRVTGGTLLPPLFDVGVIALAEGPSSEVNLELTESTVKGRLSQQGRDVLVLASAQAKVDARIERSTLGESGQDGLCAVAVRSPATATVEIADSTIEGAAQTNLEGSILNLPASDPARADDSIVDITVERSVIRDAGAVDGFRDTAQNIWMGPTYFVEAPFAKGHYRLCVRESSVQHALRTGIALGYTGAEFGVAPDEGQYEVQLRNNTIADNGAADISLSTTHAQIDAQQNYWGLPTGLADQRVRLLEQAQRSQLDASQPLTEPTNAK